MKYETCKSDCSKVGLLLGISNDVLEMCHDIILAGLGSVLWIAGRCCLNFNMLNTGSNSGTSQKRSGLCACSMNQKKMHVISEKEI